MPRIAGLIPNDVGRQMLRDHDQKQRSKGSNKYGAVRVLTEDGVQDSQHEANWVNALNQLQRDGFIQNVRNDKRELKFAFDVNGVRIGEYTADASFDVVRDCELLTIHGYQVLRAGQHCVCDAKSKQTRKIRDYPLRKNLLYALHGIKILEL